jgi:hypothetical protein
MQTGYNRAMLGKAPAKARAVAVLLAAAATSGCVAPAVTEGGYHAKTTGTLKVVSSALATAKLAMTLDANGRDALALTDQTVSQAESDASSAQSSWRSRQPPADASLRLRDQVRGPIQDAVSALTDLRVAERRDDHAAIRRALAEVDAAIREVGAVTRAVSG